MTAAAFKACYSEWKVIKTRSVVQLVFEIPIEESDAAYQALGGMPIAAKEVWCGIARLQSEREVMPTEQGTERRIPKESSQSIESSNSRSVTPPRPSVVPASATGADIKERRPFSALPYPQQAALRCNDPIYRAFLREMCGHRPAANLDDIEQAADFIRERCGVESRADIRPGTDAESKWLELESRFAAWQTADRVGLAPDPLPRLNQPELASIGRGESR